VKGQFAPFVAKSEITHHIVQNCCLRSFRKKKLPMCMAHSQKQGCESAKGKKEGNKSDERCAAVAQGVKLNNNK
jgi:hypothetical protein